MVTLVEKDVLAFVFKTLYYMIALLLKERFNVCVELRKLIGLTSVVVKILLNVGKVFVYTVYEIDYEKQSLDYVLQSSIVYNRIEY